MADRAYEELTEEEQKQLAEAEKDPSLPPPEDGEQRPADPPAAEPPADPAAPPADEGKPQDTPAPTDEEELKAFLEANKDKSPEELARLAFQQQKRAGRAEFERRQSSDTLKSLQGRVADAMKRGEAARAEIAKRREAFEARLKDDPDGATKEVFDRQIADEEARVEAEEQGARIDAAVGLAREAFPEFDKVSQYTRAFAGTLYSPEEVDSIDDGRHLIVLELARRFAVGYRQGLWGMDGTPRIETKPVAETDPRLAKPETVQTLSSAPARSGGGGKTLEQRAAEIDRMSPAEFAKFSETPEFEQIMRQLGS